MLESIRVAEPASTPAESAPAFDLTTLFGILAGVGLVVGAIAAGEGGLFFLNWPSVMIVFGGTLGATLINYRFSDLLSVFKVLRKAFTGATVNYHATIELLVHLAEKARREGLLSLEREIDLIPDGFTRGGLQFAVDGADPETIRSILEAELAGLEERHKLGQSIFLSMAGFAPAFGMIGTLIGLIQMLQSLDNPAQLGFGMATALITTFYGAMAAYLFFLPLAGKLANRSREELLAKELVLEGIFAIQNGDNPRIVREKLMTYIAPKSRVLLPVPQRVRER
ncbi:MAG: motility protein A [Calditrichaeota bacterium]|nr:motility protein A [Calditrichota bacterium]